MKRDYQSSHEAGNPKTKTTVKVMRKRTTCVTLLVTVFLIAIIGITACDNSSLTTGYDVGDTNKENPLFAFSNESIPSEFTIEAESYDNNVDLEANNPDTGAEIIFNASSSNTNSVTGTLQISNPYISPGTDPFKTRSEYQAYKNSPKQISYNGYSTLYYKVQGQSYSYSLTSVQVAILNELQQKLDHVNALLNNGEEPTQLSVAGDKKDDGTLSKPLDEMSSNEIKKWLKKQGYKVKKLGNRRFQITRIYHRGKNKIGFTSVFNAKTGRREPGYAVSKNGKVKSKHLAKENKRQNSVHHKTKMKQKIGNDTSYLIIDIKQKIKNK